MDLQLPFCSLFSGSFIIFLILLCSLPLWFDDIFDSTIVSFLFLYLSCICYIFLFCGSHKTFIKHIIFLTVYFKLITTYLWTHIKLYIFILLLIQIICCQCNNLHLFVFCVYSQIIVGIVIFITLYFNLYSKVISDLPVIITTLEYSKFTYILVLPVRFIFLYFPVAN